MSLQPTLNRHLADWRHLQPRLRTDGQPLEQEAQPWRFQWRRRSPDRDEGQHSWRGERQTGSSSAYTSLTSADPQGTDIGGSVRIPSAMCGLYTIRPCQRRVPYGKATNSGLGQEGVLSVAGPMARSMASVELFMRTVLDACAGDFDASAMPFPFNGQRYDIALQHKKLAFGVARTDGHVHATPPVLRAIEITVEALKKAGHEGEPPAWARLRGSY